MSSGRVKNLFCGFGFLLNKEEKKELNQLALAMFDSTPLHKRPRPATLVTIIVSRRYQLKKQK